MQSTPRRAGAAAVALLAAGVIGMASTAIAKAPN